MSVEYELEAVKEQPKRVRVLRRAEMLICGPRTEEYGPPVENFATIAKMWSAFLGVDLTGAQVANCMALLKIARLKQCPTHKDSHDDAAGYMALAYECATSPKEDS